MSPSMKPATCALSTRCVVFINLFKVFFDVSLNIFNDVLKILLIVEVDSECFLFVEYYGPAHARRKQKPGWQHDHIPNWPHLKTLKDNNAEKYVESFKLSNASFIKSS